MYGSPPTEVSNRPIPEATSPETMITIVRIYKDENFIKSAVTLKKSITVA
jgi:hypothetical protein